MRKHTLAAVAAGLAAFGLVYSGTESLVGQEEAPRRAAVQIGMVESLCRDTPRPLVMALVPPFRTLMKSQTGLDSDLTIGGDAFCLGGKLADGTLQLGIFQGIEFAWAREKYPQLRPLAVIVNLKPELRAVLIVPARGGADRFSDLKGRSLVIPRYSHEHCYQFLNRLCRDQGAEPRSFLSRITKPADAEEALDEVVDGLVGAAIVEEIPLDRYQRRKPGRFQRLRVMQRSEVFPASVVAYRPGNLDEGTLQTFRKGMLNAHKDTVGKQLLTWWRMTSFEPVPADYEETLRNIVKRYPTPERGSGQSPDPNGAKSTKQ